MAIGSGDTCSASVPCRRIGLVGCVKEKTERPRPAKDLYVSPLFASRRAYVERSCSEWWVLSAEHGLVHPDDVLAPYDTALKGAGRLEIRAWSKLVLGAIAAQVRPAAGDVIEFHAGAEYREFGLAAGLLDRGCVVVNPTQGLRIGAQLRFYKAANGCP